ncbi:nucleotide-binding universal stress UspA family protein [Arthrobacter stackebrandtii]|uniref:Nucleotide-binding universal stress UspA family protein n=1 Tax=Arthrobacter stackebrandtii TaxID=272161 RepID=A0ABS4YVG6_9MICC|nr:universal stress protein [Arthrobacter stackebrandtii]MBP2412792.1 nucleotide-binding universal stress UspA family protein [Arthrobacter stackebrandtii]PYG99856.1 universal stress protein UspA [Arthrobacter stackebrandtii]
MRYVVGYSANARGGDAVNLAVALARRQGAALDLVMVMPQDSPYNGVYPPVAGFGDILAKQVSDWLDEGLALVPNDVPAQAHIRRGESEAEALIAAAEELGAVLLVIGASSTGLFRRFTVGSVASALLHASTVPVVLAPSGYSRTKPITRLTCALGSRAGAEDVLRTGIAMARRRELPLRLVSLVALGPGDSDATIADAEAHLRAVAEASQGVDPDDLTNLDIDVVVGHGRTIEDAVDALSWKKGEILLIGSSRLAQNNSIFLGATANRILRALPVPMIVVPRNYVPLSDALFQTTALPVVAPKTPEAPQ